MRIRVPGEQSRLKKHEASEPHSSGSAEGRQKLLGRDRLDKEQQKCGQKDCRAVKRSGPQRVQLSRIPVFRPVGELSSEAGLCQIDAQTGKAPPAQRPSSFVLLQ
jgi:hypothetical protein